MAVSPLTNIVFINQNMHVVANTQTAQYNRYDLQNLFAQTLVNEKEKIVEKIQPVEESYKIDPNREHEHKKAKEQEDGRKKSAKHKSGDDAKKDDAKEDSEIVVNEDDNPHIDIRV